MKKWIVIVVGILTSAMGCAAMYRTYSHRVVESDLSEVYLHYRDLDNLRASFVKGYRINDTLSLNVTLLEAKDDSAWLMIKNDFDVPIISEEYRDFFDNSNPFSIWFAPKNNYKLPMDPVMENNDVVVVSYNAKTISIFHVTSKKQYVAIFKKKMKELKQ